MTDTLILHWAVQCSLIMRILTLQHILQTSRVIHGMATLTMLTLTKTLSLIMFTLKTTQHMLQD